VSVTVIAPVPPASEELPPPPPQPARSKDKEGIREKERRGANPGLELRDMRYLEGGIDAAAAG
jgi:hypothetical protein